MGLTKAEKMIVGDMLPQTHYKPYQMYVSFDAGTKHAKTNMQHHLALDGPCPMPTLCNANEKSWSPNTTMKTCAHIMKHAITWQRLIYIAFGCV